MIIRSRKLLIFLSGFFLLPIDAEYIGEFSIEDRHFLNDSKFGQSSNHSSFTFSPEIFLDLQEEGIFHFKAKLRNDQEDKERNLVDIQEFYFIDLGDAREIKYGISKEFWGVTETGHRVDIINQTDSSESFDGEDKLGQPMIKISMEKDWGLLDVYALLGFRERTYAGQDGRLRFPLVVDTNNPKYESTAKNKRTDFAIRWSHYFDNFEVALSHFSGTSREPRFIPSQKKLSGLTPFYETIDQTGLEALYLVGSLALKLEAITRSGQEDRFSALTAGFEYTQIGILDSRLDLGWLFEINHDDRIYSSPFILGTRLTFNDNFDTQLLFGVSYNNSSSEISSVIEASRRIGACCMISLESIYFGDTDKENGQLKLFESFKEDNFFRIEFTYYLGE